MELFLSNRLEALYERFEEPFFRAQVSFCRPVVVVPSLMIKSYLIRKLTQAYPHRAILGVDFVLPQQAIEAIFSPRAFPSTLDIRLALAPLCIRPEEVETFLQVIYKACWSGMVEEGETLFGKRAALLFEQIVEQKKKWEMPFRILRAKPEPLRKDPLFLFAFSSMDPLLQALFLKHDAASWYLICPSMMFLGDVVSDRHAARLISSFFSSHSSSDEKKAFCELLFSRNTLLANVGAPFRSFFAAFEDGAHETEEHYFIPDDIARGKPFIDFVPGDRVTRVSESPTLLGYLQSDLLLLLGPRSEKIPITPDDRSLQMHRAPSLLEEVEVLYDTLLDFAAERTLEPGAIVVWTSDIERYRPYIERVFRKKDSAFSYQIFSGHFTRKEHPLLSAFLTLFDLYDTKMEARTLFALFSSASFRKKFHLEEEDLDIIRALFERTGFLQGRNSEEIHNRFTSGGYVDIKTLHRGTFAALVDQFLRMWMTEEYDIEAGKIASRMIMTFRELFCDLESLFREEKQGGLEWIALLETILEKYFFSTSEEHDDKELLLTALRTLRKALRQNCNPSFSFTHLKTLLVAALEEGLEKRDNCIQKEVVFTSEKPFCADAVALLGMNEGNGSGALIIEAILAARKMVTISFQGLSSQDRMHMPPAFSVEELVRAVEGGYTLTSPLIEEHELIEELGEQKSEEKSFNLPSLICTTSDIVELDFLRRIAKNPLKTYLEQNFHLHFSYPEREKIGACFTKKDFYSLLQQSRGTSPDEFRAIIQACPKTGQGVVFEAIEHTLIARQKEFFEKAALLGFDVSNMLTIDLSASCHKKEEIGERHFVLPAPCVGGKRVVGKLEGIVSEGFLFSSRYSFANMVRAWPDILIRASIAPHFVDIRPDVLICLEEARRKALKIKPVSEELEHYVAFALRCIEQPFCVLPDGIGDILAGRGPDMDDPYARFFTERVDIKPHISGWQEEAEALFSHVEVIDG
jgi:hypothetical protein